MESTHELEAKVKKLGRSLVYLHGKAHIAAAMPDGEVRYTPLWAVGSGLEYVGSIVELWWCMQAFRHLRGAPMFARFDRGMRSDKPLRIPKATAQQVVIAKLSAAETGVSVLWGPPGTGKTSTLISVLLSKLTASQSAPHVYCAPTRKALLGAAERLLRELPASFVAQAAGAGKGVQLEASPSEPTNLLEWLLNTRAEIGRDSSLVELASIELQRHHVVALLFSPRFELADEQRNELVAMLEAEPIDGPAVRAALARARPAGGSARPTILNFVTVCSALRTVYRSKKHRPNWGFVCLDEAGRVAPIPGFMIAHCGKAAALAGDPMQLTVHTSLGPMARDYADTTYSVLEHHLQAGSQAFMLNRNFRTSVSGMLPYVCLYGPKLLPAVRVQSCGPLVAPSVYSNRHGQVQVCVVQGEESVGKRSRHHVQGQATAVDVVKQLLAAREQVGVLCPYKHQVQRLEVKLAGTPAEVHTVDSAQGCEYDNVVLLLTPSDVRKSFFSLEGGRFNVGVTRHKKRLILVIAAALVQALKSVHETQLAVVPGSGQPIEIPAIVHRGIGQLIHVLRGCNVPLDLALPAEPAEPPSEADVCSIAGYDEAEVA